MYNCLVEEGWLIKKIRIWRCKFSCTFQSQKMSDMLQSKFMKAVQLLLHCVHLRHLHLLILRILILVLRRKGYGQNIILRLLEKVQEINAWQVELFVGTFWTFHLLISWSFIEDYYTCYTWTAQFDKLGGWAALRLY